jgi:hypothetical protein
MRLEAQILEGLLGPALARIVPCIDPLALAVNQASPGHSAGANENFALPDGPIGGF